MSLQNDFVMMTKELENCWHQNYLHGTAQVHFFHSEMETLFIISISYSLQHIRTIIINIVSLIERSFGVRDHVLERSR